MKGDAQAIADTEEPAPIADAKEPAPIADAEEPTPIADEAGHAFSMHADRFLSGLHACARCEEEPRLSQASTRQLGDRSEDEDRLVIISSPTISLYFAT